MKQKYSPHRHLLKNKSPVFVCERCKKRFKSLPLDAFEFLEFNEKQNASYIICGECSEHFKEGEFYGRT